MLYFDSKLYIKSNYGLNIGEVLIYDFAKTTEDPEYLSKMRPPTMTWNQLYGETVATDGHYLIICASLGQGADYHTGILYVYDLTKEP